MWEDQANKNGGRFMLRIKRKYANMYIIIITYINLECGKIFSYLLSGNSVKIWTISAD